VNGQQSNIQLAFRDAATFACVTRHKDLIDQFLKWLASREDIAAVFGRGSLGFAFGSFTRHGPIVLPPKRKSFVVALMIVSEPIQL
jgi:hypothetical protein